MLLDIATLYTLLMLEKHLNFSRYSCSTLRVPFAFYFFYLIINYIRFISRLRALKADTATREITRKIVDKLD